MTRFPPSQALHGADPGPEPARPDGVIGDDPTTPQDESADDIQNANNTDSPWVDQSQTYTSHASHQVFLREYDMVGWRAGRDRQAAGRHRRRRHVPGDTTSPPCYNDGNATDGSISTWAAVKKQAAQKLGLLLKDKDVTNIPMLATDPYGEFIPGRQRSAAVRLQDRRQRLRGRPAPARRPGQPGRRCPTTCGTSTPRS